MLLEEVDKRNQAHQVTDQNLKDDIRRLKKGVLSFQGFMFKSHCRELIDSEREITLKEYEDIAAEHEAYNGLGGNHEGDVLFALVKQKFENHIRSQHEEQ